MYLSALRFVILFAIISTSASVYLDFTDELPVHLSDDILISKISRRSVPQSEAANINTDENQRTTEEVSTTTNGVNAKSEEHSESTTKHEAQDVQESSLVFLPSFGRKSKRNLAKRDVPNSEEDKNQDNKPKIESEEPIGETEEEQESGLVFLPSFGRRSRRDTSSQNTFPNEKTEEPKNGQSKQTELEDAQESGLVFLPSFGRRSRRSLAKRDIPNSEKDKNQDNKPKIESEEPIGETEEEQESGLVFLPSFGRRSRRDTSSQNSSPNEKTEGPKNGQSKQTELEDVQESGLVFLPSFGRRSRRSLAKRDIPNSEKDKNRDNKPKIESGEPISETEEEQESGLVFLPSFGRRSRRDTSSQNSSPNEKTGEPKNGQSKQTELEDVQESGLVFLPSFGRRSRRSLAKRDIPNSEKDKDQDNKPKLESEEPIGETEEEHESGLVFLPSFVKRSRRDTSEESKEKQNQVVKSVTTERVEVNHEKKSGESEDVQESSLVFLPSFSKRNRREVSEDGLDKNGLTHKREVKKNADLDEDMH